MRRFKAVLFDVDGTLLDTTEFIFQAYEHTLRNHGLPSHDRATIASLIGIRLEEIYEQLAPGADVDVLAAEHRTFQANNMHLSRPFPGANETLKMLKSAGLKIAAVTTRSRLTVLETLALAKMTGYIDYTVALEDVAHTKPHPEPVLAALKHLSTQSKEAVMVGDSDVDVLAGKNAGTVTVGVTYGFHGARIAETHPDYLINSIEEVIPLVLPSCELKSEAVPIS